MTLKQFFGFCVEIGISQDPRGKTAVQKVLEENRKHYEGLGLEQKKEYDREKMVNPYDDSRILYDDESGRAIKNIMVGIDMETSELLLADRLREKGVAIDVVMGHHPEGQSYASFFEVMRMQSDILAKNGVPINVAEGLMEKRIEEVGRKVMPGNHARPVDAAKLLKIPYINLHTPADNCVATYLQGLVDREKPYLVGDVVSLLKQVDEYHAAALRFVGPKIIAGSEKKRAGRVFVDMTGGTEGAEDIFEKLSDSGIGTVVGMHMGEKHLENAKKHHVNVVIAGHISSDSLGLNILLAKAMKKFGKINVIPCSGYIYIKR